jgi:hypothetical protein
MKRKTQAKANISGKKTANMVGYMNQTPFCMCENAESPMTNSNVGFSTNGSYRNSRSRVGATHQNSTIYTPYKNGVAKGNGGYNGKYITENQIYLANRPTMMGNDANYVRPPPVETKEAINHQYKWIKSGVYPYYWVQEVGGNSDINANYTQGSYIEKLHSNHLCVVDINEDAKYEGYCVNSCNKQNAKPYTKAIKQPLSEGDYLQHMKMRCSENPTLFPYRTYTGKSCNNTVSAITRSPFE